MGYSCQRGNKGGADADWTIVHTEHRNYTIQKKTYFEVRRLVLFFLAYIIGIHGAFAVESNQTAFREAKAVWPVGMEKEKNLTVHFRAVIDHTMGQNTRLAITASSAYKVHVNGRFLAHGPCVAAHGFFRLDQYHFSHLLQDGENLIAIEVAGYNMPSFYLLDQPAFLQAEVIADGEVLVATGSDIGKKEFEARISGQRKRDVIRYSHARPFTEYYILDDMSHDWKTNKKAAFEAVEQHRTEEKEIIPRGVKYPDYSVIAAIGSIGDSIYRFPYNATGFLGFTLQVSEPSELVVYFDEILKYDDVDPTRLVCQNYLIYELQPGTYSLETFEPYTMQYVKPVFRRGKGRISDWYVRQYVSADVAGSSFGASDPRLEKVFEAARETVRQNALDVLTDCPSRERGAWLGDGYFVARAAATISGNTLVERNFFQNYLLPASFDNVPDGMLPMCYPCDHPNGLFIPNWAMWFVIQLEEYYTRSGDVEMVHGLKERVAKLIAYFDGFLNKDGLLENLEKWVFLDWSASNDFTAGVNYPTNMQFARVLEAAGRLYGNQAWKDQARHIKSVVLEQAFDGRFFRDHAVREGGSLVVQPPTTEACQYYAFYFDVASPESHPWLWRVITEELGPKRYRDNHVNQYPDVYLSNTFMGEYMRMELLCRYDEVPRFIEENTANLMKQVELTGTLWEQQYRTLNTSCSHGFAAHVAYLYQRALAGIDEVNVLDRKIRLVFRNTGLDWCVYEVPLDEGTLSISWKIEADGLAYSLQVPNGYGVELVNETNLPVYAIANH